MQCWLKSRSTRWCCTTSASLRCGSGQLQLALPYLTRAWELARNSPEVWLGLARCRYGLGDWEASLELIEQAGAKGFTSADFDALRKAMVGEAGGRKVFCVGRNKTGRPPSRRR